MLALYRDARILAGTCCLLGMFFAGALIALVHVPEAPPFIEATGRDLVILEGCVVEPPAISGRARALHSRTGARCAAHRSRYIRRRRDAAFLRYGQRIEIDARIRAPRNYGNPGAFDYRNYRRAADLLDGIGRGRRIARTAGSCGSAMAKAAMDLRAGILHRIETIYRGNDYLVRHDGGPADGQSYQLQRVVDGGVSQYRTFHAIVISGTHVAILAAFFLFLLRICFVPEGAAMLLTSMAAWLYAVH